MDDMVRSPTAAFELSELNDQPQIEAMRLDQRIHRDFLDILVLLVSEPSPFLVTLRVEP